jgi:hypothetical protein
VLLEQLKAKAIGKGLMGPQDELDAARAFLLVRDMPYARASSREPETIVEEWRGTCSGKHYLLKALFAELGYASRLIVCTTVADLDPGQFSGKLRRLLEQSNGRFVDVHNYLILELPDGEMIVDATWPLDTKERGTVVNEQFDLGKSQKIAAEPIESWVVPDGRDPQEFKNEILNESYSPQELAHREAFIEAIGELSESM